MQDPTSLSAKNEQFDQFRANPDEDSSDLFERSDYYLGGGFWMRFEKWGAGGKFISYKREGERRPERERRRGREREREIEEWREREKDIIMA